MRAAPVVRLARDCCSVNLELATAMAVSLHASPSKAALFGLICAVVLAGATQSFAQAGGPSTRPDLSGVWYFVSDGPSPQARWETATLTPEYQAIAKRQMEIMRAAEPGAGDANPCPASPRLPAMMLNLYPIEVIATPDLIVTVHESNRGIRHIYMDGRANNPNGKRNNTGFSTGRWEGDTLVVQTTGLPANGTITTGAPHSDQLRITERIRMTGPDLMENTITAEDPKALVKPIAVKRVYKRHAEFVIGEYACQDNIRDFEPTTK